MTLPQAVSRDEWLSARQDLLAKEKEFAQAKWALAAGRRELPMVRIEKDYLFQGAGGRASLLDLFDGRRQLITYHFMFESSWDQGCPHCSFATDNVGHLAHLHARDTTFALVSLAPQEKLAPFKERMGWTVPWYSSAGSDFNRDFGATTEDGHEMPGVSAFLREGDAVFHTYSAGPDGGMDLLMGTYNYLDLTALGNQEGDQGPSWLRHHDRYSA